MKSMATLTIDEKKIVGKLANEVKGRIEAAVAERRTYLEQEEVNKKLQSETIDVTLPFGTSATVVLPDGSVKEITAGSHELKCTL